MTISQIRYVITIADCGSMNKAASLLFVSQPSLSASVKELEEELGIQIFTRNNRGIILTPAGEEFVSYARSCKDQFDLITNKYIEKTKTKKRFGVSLQHYTFAVDAFIEVVKSFGMDEYDFAVRETVTYDVIRDVRNMKSEVGILYVNDFNRKVLDKIFDDNEVEFVELLECKIYAYMAKNHPLAKCKKVTLDDLSAYPCLAFEQGEQNSFYFAEEVLSTYEYARIIHATDRATLLNLMMGLQGYTLCSGIICDHLNGDNYVAVKLDSEERMTIGYIKRKDVSLSPIGKMYIDKISTYRAL